MGAGVEEGVLREVVVAMSYTPEGDATAYYLIDALQEAVAAAARHPPCQEACRRHRNRVHGPEHDRQRGLRQKGCLRGRARPLGPPPTAAKPSAFVAKTTIVEPFSDEKELLFLRPISDQCD